MDIDCFFWVIKSQFKIFSIVENKKIVSKKGCFSKFFSKKVLSQNKLYQNIERAHRSGKKYRTRAHRSYIWLLTLKIFSYLTARYDEIKYFIVH